MFRLSALRCVAGEDKVASAVLLSILEIAFRDHLSAKRLISP
jgi:hypothetical protein